MINRVSITLIATIAGVILTTGCVTKPYKTPNVSSTVDSLYRVLENRVDTTANDSEISWREFFTDTLLVGYIDSALVNNFDMQIAVRNILKAEAQFKQSKAAFSPSISASIGYGIESQTGSPLNYDAQAGGQFSWEIDLWGKIASAKRSAYASMLEQRDVREGLQSTIVANIATLYYTLVGYDAQMAVMNETIKNRREYLATTRSLKQSAQVNEVAVQQAVAQLSEVHAAQANIELAIIRTENAFRALLGEPSGAVERHPVIDITDAKLVTKIGCSAQLLKNRPDVRAAENSYRSAHEMWNVSRAAMYPSLTISASANIANLFGGHFSILNALAGLTEPIWNGRKLRTQKEIAKLSAEQAELNFRKTLFLAGQEVSDALAVQLKTREQALAQVVQLRALRLSYQYSMELFVNGYATYLDVLLAQTGVFNTEIALIETYLQNLNARIELYRALGGGIR